VLRQSLEQALPVGAAATTLVDSSFTWFCSCTTCCWACLAVSSATSALFCVQVRELSMACTCDFNSLKSFSLTAGAHAMNVSDTITKREMTLAAFLSMVNLHSPVYSVH